MRWGKFILIFQAVMTLIIGWFFLTQFLVIDANDAPDPNDLTLTGDDYLDSLIDLKERFSKASYILVTIALMELIIIWRLVS